MTTLDELKEKLTAAYISLGGYYPNLCNEYLDLAFKAGEENMGKRCLEAVEETTKDGCECTNSGAGRCICFLGDAIRTIVEGEKK